MNDNHVMALTLCSMLGAAIAISIVACLIDLFRQRRQYRQAKVRYRKPPLSE